MTVGTLSISLPKPKVEQRRPSRGGQCCGNPLIVRGTYLMGLVPGSSCLRCGDERAAPPLAHMLNALRAAGFECRFTPSEEIDEETMLAIGYTRDEHGTWQKPDQE